MDNHIVLCKDDNELCKFASVNSMLAWLQDHAPYSWHHAFTFEGYTVKDNTGKDITFTTTGYVSVNQEMGVN